MLYCMGLLNFCKDRIDSQFNFTFISFHKKKVKSHRHHKQRHRRASHMKSYTSLVNNKPPLNWIWVNFPPRPPVVWPTRLAPCITSDLLTTLIRRNAGFCVRWEEKKSRPRTMLPLVELKSSTLTI